MNPEPLLTVSLFLCKQRQYTENMPHTNNPLDRYVDRSECLSLLLCLNVGAILPSMDEVSFVSRT